MGWPCSATERFPRINVYEKRPQQSTEEQWQDMMMRISVRTSYKVLKMKEDAHVAYMTANELEQRQKLADTENPHQKSHKVYL